jgi:DNA-binding transcriptional ArsR family regulator
MPKLRAGLCSTSVERKRTFLGKDFPVPKTSAKSHDRSSEDAVSFALAHRVRIEILSALTERDYCQSELARLLRESESTVQYHLQELLAAGAIEVSKSRHVRNFDQRFYRATTIAYFGLEEMASWSLEKRQAFWGLIIQNSGAEALSALHAGTISEDENSWLTWARFNVDRHGREAMFEVLSWAWQCFIQIEAESKARQKETGEELRTVIGNLQAYPRSRNAQSSYPDPPST